MLRDASRPVCFLSDGCSSIPSLRKFVVHFSQYQKPKAWPGLARGCETVADDQAGSEAHNADVVSVKTDV